jgi:hypothetical protein
VVSTQRRFVIVTVALVAVTGALIGAGMSALQNRSNAEAWARRAVDAEVELADKRAALDEATAGLDELESLSSGLQERVDELADDKAQSGDNIAMVEMQRDAFERVAQGYADVTAKWQTCVEGHEQYQQVLTNPAKYDSGDVKRFLKDLETLCSDAQDADDKLRSQLSR